MEVMREWWPYWAIGFTLHSFIIGYIAPKEDSHIAFWIVLTSGLIWPVSWVCLLAWELGAKLGSIRKTL